MHCTALTIGYLIISALLVGIWVMSFYELQLRGYWTEKVIGWLWLAYTVMCIRVFWQRVAIKIYLAFLSSLLLLSLMAMGIPLFALVHFISTTGDYQKITLNDAYRLELTHHQALCMMRVYVYEKQNFFIEKNVARPLYQ